MGCYRINHPSGTSGFTVSHKNWAIQTALAKAYTVTFWARTDNPGTALFYWDSYSSISPYIDATSAGRLPFEVTTEWQEYTFTVDEGRDFYFSDVKFMLAAFKPVGNEYGIQRVLWVDDVVVTERDSTAEPLTDWNALIYPPLIHRLSAGSQLIVNVDAAVAIGPATQEASGVSFHSISGWGRHPYDPNMIYQLVGAKAPLEESLRQLKNPMTRFYDVGAEPPGILGSIDKVAELMDLFDMPKEWTVIELEPASADFTFTPAEWASAVAHSETNGYGFRYWEIGNETYTRKATAFPTSDDYVDHFIDVSTAIKAVKADAQIGISAWPGQPNWGNYILQAAQGHYDYVVGHYYSGTSPYTNSFEDVVLKANYQTLDEILRMNALIEDYNPGGDIYLLDTEWGLHEVAESGTEPLNKWRNANVTGMMHRAVRLIYYARESLMRGASGWEMFSRHVSPYTSISFGHLSYDYPDKKTMLYWLPYFFNRHCGEMALDITGTAPWYNGSTTAESGPQTPVLATLSDDGNTMYFVIANGSWTINRPALFSLSNFAPISATGVGLSQDSLDADPMVHDEATAISDVPVTIDGNTVSFNVPAHTVVFVTLHKAAATGRYVFYNNSAFDGDDPAANSADDLGIATDKAPLLEGQTASFANYTSYSKGINGIMVDLPTLGGTPTATDFTFKVGNDSNPANWTYAPAPSTITVRNGDGDGGSDRVTILWPEGAIVNTWLEVTVKANATTGLASDDVFFFGNAPGETGNSATDAIVTPTDEIGVRNNPHSLSVNPAGIDDAYDFNRDRRVSPTDTILSRNNGTNSLTALALITPVYNEEPTVDAGADTSVSLTGTASLAGTADDDGLPDPPGLLTTTWSKSSGPGDVTFGDASAVDTTATFSGEGTYILQLEAYDGEFSVTDTIDVEVFPAVAGVFFQDDFDDNDLAGWTTLAGTMETFQFDGGPGYELHAMVRDSIIRTNLTDTNLSDTVYISFKIRHTFGAPPNPTSGGSGYKSGWMWFVDDSGAGFGLNFALDQNGSGALELRSTTDNGATDAGIGNFTNPPDPNGYDLKQVELVYNRLTNQVECFYEGSSMGTFSVSAGYSNFTRVVIHLKNHYDGFWGQIDINDLRIASGPSGS